MTQQITKKQITKVTNAGSTYRQGTTLNYGKLVKVLKQLGVNAKQTGYCVELPNNVKVDAITSKGWGARKVLGLKISHHSYSLRYDENFWRAVKFNKDDQIDSKKLVAKINEVVAEAALREERVAEIKKQREERANLQERIDAMIEQKTGDNSYYVRFDTKRGLSFKHLSEEQMAKMVDLYVELTAQ